MGNGKIKKKLRGVKIWLGFSAGRFKKIRAADAKEVGVGNPAEETCCYPNVHNVTVWLPFVNILSAWPAEWNILALRGMVLA
jgi:hypothetical protein